VGNGQESPQTPWRYADYPAALPHVVGVSALGPHGGVPTFSNRDAAYVDIAAPGIDIFSTVPRNLVDSSRPLCTGHPYSDCGPFEFRNAIGTSFAAPQVTAAAALLIGQDPSLAPDQVSWLLERSATDERTATGCSLCAPGRDVYTGWGRLNVDAALTALAAGNLPPADRYEPDDNAGSWAHAFGPARTITATLDFWDDQVDVFSINVPAGDRLYTRLTPLVPAQTALVLWKPGTTNVDGLSSVLENQAARSLAVGLQQRLAFTASVGGTYYVEVKLVHQTRNPVPYTLSVAVKPSGV
jgi:subtilisin family serine protease